MTGVILQTKEENNSFQVIEMDSHIGCMFGEVLLVVQSEVSLDSDASALHYIKSS